MFRMIHLRMIHLTSAWLALMLFVALAGCDDAPRVVQETDEYSFDDIAAQAAADTVLSEVEE